MIREKFTIPMKEQTVVFNDINPFCSLVTIEYDFSRAITCSLHLISAMSQYKPSNPDASR